jgi:hypothetical protein
MKFLGKQEIETFLICVSNKKFVNQLPFALNEGQDEGFSCFTFFQNTKAVLVRATM